MRRPVVTIALAAGVALSACGSSGHGDKPKPVAGAATRAAGAPNAAATTSLPIGHLLYRRYLNDDQSEAAIYAVGPGETNGRAITHPPAGAADDLATANPDGSRITFTRCTDRCRLFTAAIDGSGIKRLTPKCCIEESDAGYSPDGRTIAFGRAWGNVENDQIQYSEVFRMTASGHERQRLTHLSGKGYQGDTGAPSFSPDGKRIVFSVVKGPTAPHAGDRAVFIMNADGSHQHRLTPWSLKAGDHPRFSPDGSRVISRTVPEDGPGGDLYTVRPDGSGLTRLTHDVPGMLSAAWSPDGEHIAFGREGDDGGNPDIWIMKADGTSPARLTNAPEWDSLPTWGA
jgi:Tol biopolymer transport system component